MLNSTWERDPRGMPDHRRPNRRAARSELQRRPTAVDPEIQDIMWLRSRDRDRVLAVLRRTKS